MVAPDVSGRSIAELVDLSGRVVLVTGGGRGIGLAIAARLAEAGAAVAVGDVDADGAGAAARALKRFGGPTLAVTLDVTSTGSVREAMAAVTAELGGLDVLVNNAGIYPPALVADMPDDQWSWVLEVNTTGAMRCSREAIPHLRRSRAGVICNVSSTAAFRISNPGIGAYVASKHALDGLTKALALELGGEGVRVVAVAPTMVETEGIAELRAAAAARGSKLGDPAAFAASLPLGRPNVPDDVARVVLFLVSDLAAMVTGSSVAVDGGSLIR
ncbi:MAG TPA: SDR family NAD(P)-dependent oxidoreductase [Acidimicrobiia bacterium]|nr:SDR family NAD(P)-dependent oxidoreductase [Acidimicrobiia bacterium]